MESYEDSIKNLVERAYLEKHSTSEFIAGSTSIPVTGKVFGTSELINAVTASLNFWLTAGPYTEQFESVLARKIGVRHAFMVNSGSSANLLALTSLTSKIHGENMLRPGDEVITVAAAFPTRTIGLGLSSVSSEILVPSPPARIITLMR